MEQYNFVKYETQKHNSVMDTLKKTAIHILTMQFFINKQNNAQEEDSPAVVKNLNFSIRKGELIGICGQVGMGKTSLFNAILGELRCVTNRDKIRTYVSDEVNKLNFKYEGEENEEIDNDPMFDRELPHVYIDGKVAYFT